MAHHEGISEEWRYEWKLAAFDRALTDTVKAIQEIYWPNRKKVGEWNATVDMKEHVDPLRKKLNEIGVPFSAAQVKFLLTARLAREQEDKDREPGVGY